MTTTVPQIHAGLISNIARGDKNALAQLYQTSSPRLLGMIIRLVRRRDWAEEILHDTFIQIWQSAAVYDQQKGEPQFWLNQIARNRAIDYLRKHENRCCSVDDIAEAEQGFQAHLPADDIHQEAQRLQHCMEHLPSEQRQSIALAYYRGLSQTEISQALDQPEGTVKSWIRRALAHLRECVGL
jgi:RNA polymerase sigma factor, sigma-70 family